MDTLFKVELSMNKDTLIKTNSKLIRNGKWKEKRQGRKPNLLNTWSRH